MLSTVSLGYWIAIRLRGGGSSLNRKIIFKRGSNKIKFTNQVCLSFSSQSFASPVTTDDSYLQTKSRVHYDSLRLLEWDKLCDSVASFAGTSPGRDAVKEQLWTLTQTYEDSLKLLEETNAAVEMHKHGACRLGFSSVKLPLVKSAIRNARRGSAVTASEAIAVANMMEVSDVLQLNLKAAIKQDGEWYNHFMPLSQQIMEMVISRPLIKMIRQVIDEDGFVKDSASSALKQSREVVRMLERKLSQLMDNLIQSEIGETSFLEVSNVGGRWCIKSGTEQPKSFKGLLLSSDSGKRRIMEPLSAVPLNDELQQARAYVAKAEREVLLTLTEKIRKDLDDIEEISNSIVRLDVINARATYSLSFEGSSPELYMPEDMDDAYTETPLPDKSQKASCHLKREWKLYMPEAYHPLLLQQHRKNLRMAKKDSTNANSKLQEDESLWKEEKGEDFPSLKMQVSAMEQAQPVPVDFFISQKTRVLIITGPNTGGKTICLKTVGLAAMMAKSGLHVLCSESVQIPWFDSVFADIGDEQSLSQSLSTFSGHLKQISDIRSQSTSQSLVLLDEVGAGTNPLEGAALGMSLLESFADSGALLTMATTHHGELKSLKYSNDAFENACMEFDEVNLKPTYKILWGVPGRSNAINISERLGLPSEVVSHARELLGAASAEINEVILDMERFKQEFQKSLHESERHLILAREHRQKLLLARRKITEHSTSLRYKKMRQISQVAATARSILHKKVRQLRARPAKPSQPARSDTKQLTESDSHSITAENGVQPIAYNVSSVVETDKQSLSERRKQLPVVGQTVQVSSLGRSATVLKVDPYKEEIVVQAGIMKLKLKIADVGT